MPQGLARRELGSACWPGDRTDPRPWCYSSLVGTGAGGSSSEGSPRPTVPCSGCPSWGPLGSGSGRKPQATRGTCFGAGDTSGARTGEGLAGDQVAVQGGPPCWSLQRRARWLWLGTWEEAMTGGCSQSGCPLAGSHLSSSLPSRAGAAGWATALCPAAVMRSLAAGVEPGQVCPHVPAVSEGQALSTPKADPAAHGSCPLLWLRAQGPCVQSAWHPYKGEHGRLGSAKSMGEVSTEASGAGLSGRASWRRRLTLGCLGERWVLVAPLPFLTQGTRSWGRSGPQKASICLGERQGQGSLTGLRPGLRQSPAAVTCL